ncbi:MAG: ABC transporter permease [Spirochaetales bacterium]|nr:ABC transporter permease [Spirochaetales bacterium]
MKMNKQSTARETFIICKRELKSFFVSPIAYIVIAVFVLASAIFFIPTFFFNDRAELNRLFAFFPLFLSFTIPAITMRVFAEEKRSGTFETLITMPLKTVSIVTGKILAVFLFSAVMVTPTLLFPLSLSIVGKFDLGPMMGGYIGTLLLAAAFSSIGVFSSSISKNQIVAFIVALAINLFLSLLHIFLVFLPSSVVGFLQFLSIDHHFGFISKGLFDIRNLTYFATIFILFHAVTVRMVEERR